MKLLLDTHAFIWWDSDPLRLSQNALRLCQDGPQEPIIAQCRQCLGDADQDADRQIEAFFVAGRVAWKPATGQQS